MKKLTDEELDSVFKNAAEGNTPSYDAAAWDALNQKLNAPRPVSFWKRWSPFILVGAVLFLAGVWVGRTSSTEERALLLNDTTNELIPQTSENENPAKPELIDPDKSATSIVHRQQNEATIEQEVSKTLNHDQQRKQIKRQSNIVAVSRDRNEANKVLEEVIMPIADSFIGHEQKMITESTFNVDAIADSSALKPEEAKDSTEISKELEGKPGRRRVYGLFIRLLASPDLSSIKFGPTELGSNIGLVGEFSLSKKFSVSSGVIRARKNYESYQEEAYGANARILEGSCTILDVPLNVTYYFASERKLSGYVTAGASSYLMLREDYIYTIKSSSGDRVYPYEAIRKNNEWFKVLNLAVGLQYQVAPRWHVQLEPFIKAPLADLGERNVRLSSLGVFTGLRYQLHSNTKHP